MCLLLVECFYCLWKVSIAGGMFLLPVECLYYLWNVSTACLVFLLLGNKLINILTDIELVRTESYKYIYLVGFLPIVSVWSFQLDGAFSGMLKTKEMRDTMIISAIVYFIVITPIGLLLRIFGKDLLGIKFLKKKSYWIKRDKDLGSMKNQF